MDYRDNLETIIRSVKNIDISIRNLATQICFNSDDDVSMEFYEALRDHSKILSKAVKSYDGHDYLDYLENLIDLVDQVSEYSESDFSRNNLKLAHEFILDNFREFQVMLMDLKAEKAKDKLRNNYWKN
jgi:hypothetical protein